MSLLVLFGAPTFGQRAPAIYAAIGNRTPRPTFDPNELKVARPSPADKPPALGDDVPPWRCGLRQFTDVPPLQTRIATMRAHRYAGRRRRFGARGLQRRPGLRAPSDRHACGLAGPWTGSGRLAISRVVAGLRFDAAR